MNKQLRFYGNRLKIMYPMKNKITHIFLAVILTFSTEPALLAKFEEPVEKTTRETGE